jgi:hypothetical protein
MLWTNHFGVTRVVWKTFTHHQKKQQEQQEQTVLSKIAQQPVDQTGFNWRNLHAFVGIQHV